MTTSSEAVDLLPCVICGEAFGDREHVAYYHPENICWLRGYGVPLDDKPETRTPDPRLERLIKAGRAVEALGRHPHITVFLRDHAELSAALDAYTHREVK